MYELFTYNTNLYKLKRLSYAESIMFTKNQIAYGLLTTAIMTICISIMVYRGGNFETMNSTQAVLMTFMPLGILFAGLLSYRKKHKNKLTFNQGVKEGFKISLVHAIASPIVFAFFYIFIDPTMLDYARKVYNMPDSPIQFVMTFDLFVQFVASLIFGIIYSAIAAVSLRKS